MNLLVTTINLIKSVILTATGNASTIIDISKYQCTFDGSKMFNFDTYETSDGIMIIVKASQGIYQDRRFGYYISEIIPRRIFFGTYHFADARYSAIASARKWAAQINVLPPDKYEEATKITRHFLDVENYGFQGKTQVQGRTWVRTFLTELESLVDVKIGIYTSYFGWRDNIAWMPEIAERDLWVANYEADKPSIPTEWFYAGKTWRIWQTCDNCTSCGGCGKPYGAASISIDKNEFNGAIPVFIEWSTKENGDDGMSSQEYDELLALIQENETDIGSNTTRIENLEEGTVSPPPEDKYDVAYIVNADPNLRLRTTPETGAVVVGMPYGSTCMVDDSVKINDSQNRGYWVMAKYQEYVGWTADWYLKKK